MGYDFLRIMLMNQVWLFEIWRTLVINFRNCSDNWGGGADLNTHPTLVKLLGTLGALQLGVHNPKTCGLI